MQKRRKLLLPLALIFCLCACGGENSPGRVERICQRFADAAGYSMEVRADLMQEEVLHYALRLTKDGDEVTAVVTEPEMLAGVTVNIAPDMLHLSYEGLVLDVPGEEGRIGGANCAPLLLSAIADGYFLHAEETELDGEKALCACFEYEYGGETLVCRVWFSAEDLPLCGEIEKNGTIEAYMGFTNVEIRDTIENTN